MTDDTQTAERESLAVLTLWQPWATLIALKVKTIETRSWAAPKSLIGQRIAIHAAKKYPADGAYPNPGYWEVSAPCGIPELVEYGGNVDRVWINRHRLPLGCIVATARLVASVRMVANDDVYKDVNHCRSGESGFIWIGRPRLERYQWNGRQYELLLTEDTEAQRPYGEFAQGRWAWLLADIEPIDPPVPFVGGQGFSKRWVRP
jgi:activating signal cointegrator 1